MNDDPAGSVPELGGLDPKDLLRDALRTHSAGLLWMAPAPGEIAPWFPRYRILELVGQGGMGAVYRACQPDLEREVALKLLPPLLATDAAFVERFRREARLLARLQCPGIVAIHDFGQTEAGHLYFVMEYVEGSDLARIIRTGSLPPEQALELTIGVCQALQYAHRRGVIHRDIKPSNILVSRAGEVKLADFGLARPMTAIDEAGRAVSQVILGTPEYMAPEQRHGAGDHRADIYALGATLYEMLTGVCPQGIFDLPSVKVPVDPRLDEVVRTAMQQDPARRYQQAGEMETAVQDIRTSARRTPAPAIPSRRLKFLRIAGAGGIGMLAVIGIALLRKNREGKGGEAQDPVAARTAPASETVNALDLPPDSVPEPPRYAGIDSPHYLPLWPDDRAEGWRQSGGGMMTLHDGQGRVEGSSSEEGVFWYAAGKLRDFSLKVQVFASDPAAASGILIGLSETGERSAATEEIRVGGAFPSLTGTGAIFLKQAPTRGIFRAGEWNELEIGAIGPRLVVALNGTVINDFTGRTPASGCIGFRTGGRGTGGIRFRRPALWSLDGGDGLFASSDAAPRFLAEFFRSGYAGSRWEWTDNLPPEQDGWRTNVTLTPDGAVWTDRGQTWRWEVDPLGGALRIRARPDEPGNGLNAVFRQRGSWRRLEGIKDSWKERRIAFLRTTNEGTRDYFRQCLLTLPWSFGIAPAAEGKRALIFREDGTALVGSGEVWRWRDTGLRAVHLQPGAAAGFDPTAGIDLAFDERLAGFEGQAPDGSARWDGERRLTMESTGLFEEAGLSREEGRSLFNGRDLSGWLGLPECWEVKDGAIRGTGNGGPPTSLIWTGGEVGDFQLDARVRITPPPGGRMNGGIHFRSRLTDFSRMIVRGAQADLDDTGQFSGRWWDGLRGGFLGGRGQESRIEDPAGPASPVVTYNSAAASGGDGSHAWREGEWNAVKIVARGKRVRIFINSFLVSDGVDASSAAPLSGLIALELAETGIGTVEYRDLYLRPLRPAGAEAGPSGTGPAAAWGALDFETDLIDALIDYHWISDDGVALRLLPFDPMEGGSRRGSGDGWHVTGPRQVRVNAAGGSVELIFNENLNSFTGRLDDGTALRGTRFGRR